ncbi:type 2 lantibiotic biosynthesis protein LanM [Allocatelliglobosispora scoriae]|uniref:Type 2 lantibiotic biosynthesis protein LanM n=1 Tax=Allocatelliglobosispora scoriae TaxID=643052 RepID=A0A841BQG3_9ACTN|nr:type 2 lanthipeptide synthetase LanM family protein [Allocatelliglobosispora scoriae]MBB5869060.1 type 2 lantibiotic biosynthesis protein LanM [Allocatelliglobosispora scoriae]
MSTDDTADFTASLGCLIEPALAGLAAQLRMIGGVTPGERDVLLDAVRESLRNTLHRKLARVLVLELNAARITGRLTAPTSAERWDEFIELTTDRSFWDSLVEHYPPMLDRVAVIVANRCAAALALAERLATDRDTLAELLGRPFGELAAATFGNGDSHRGGQAVAILRGHGGKIVYKPRSVRVDTALDALLGDLLDAPALARGVSERSEGAPQGAPGIVVARGVSERSEGAPQGAPGIVVARGVSERGEGAPQGAPGIVVARGVSERGEGAPQGALGRIRVPRVLDRGDYGWAAFAQHAYCGSEAELRHFYRGIGHWLAVMRLLGGCDLHAENVIAAGPIPMVIDCETLFTPDTPASPTGLGLAVDRAGELVDGTVLRTGLLPGRGLALGWRGVGASAVGGLPGQQPAGERPVLVDAGTDTAHIGMAPGEPEPSQNHPSPDPALGEHWDQVLAGFVELTDAMIALDKADRLVPMLARFADCPIRVVVRSTEAYAEIERMFWHPVSLHEPGPAIERAERILADMAQSVAGAPSDPAVIRAEIDDLLDGDVPFFATTPAHGRLTGPRGTHWFDEQDLAADALMRWRGADLVLERQVIQSALVSAYLNEGWLPTEETLLPPTVDLTGLDGRRRRVLATMMRRLAGEAIHGADGTVTWIAPVLNPTGWAVQPLSPDFYGGAPGVAIVVAAYQREVAAGRADPVADLDTLLDDVVRTMCLAEQKAAEDFTGYLDVRPPPLGAQIGLGGQIWSWLALDQLGAARDIALDRAVALTAQIPGAVEVDDEFSLMVGAAGSIVPLLALADRTGDERFQDLAIMLGERLVEVSREVALPTGAVGAIWPTLRWPAGLGGLAHGSTGIGWALARLALRTGQGRFADVARHAFAFEDLLWDPVELAWRDLREPERCSAAWCHGTVGIGLIAHDLQRRRFDGGGGSATIAFAAAKTAEVALGWNHTLCHGDFGAWELLDAVADTPLAPPGLDRTTLDAQLIGSIEQYGPVSGLARDAFTPGLLPGVGGVAYQLLRFDRGAGLPSVLVLGDAAPLPAGAATPGGDLR